jgi:hypothetical protein
MACPMRFFDTTPVGQARLLSFSLSFYLFLSPVGQVCTAAAAIAAAALLAPDACARSSLIPWASTATVLCVCSLFVRVLSS